jgi:hypothetical protein
MSKVADDTIIGLLRSINASSGGGGATIPSVTNLIKGDGAGNGADSGVAVGQLGTWSGITPGTGVGTALAVNIGSAGAFVTFNGALGTPSGGTLTNCIGLPVSSGVSGLGTGVSTALGVNIGTAGAFVTNGGALGTPSSGTLTNCTFPTLNQNTSGTAAGLSTPLAVGSGGTNITSYAVGDLLYASGATTLSKLADVATGNALISGGVTTAPSWGKITTSHTTGIAASGANSDITSFGQDITINGNLNLTHHFIQQVSYIDMDGWWSINQSGNGGVSLGSGHRIVWGSGTTNSNNSNNISGDTGLARNAAGIIEANNGTAGTLRDYKARNFLVGTATAPSANDTAVIAFQDNVNKPTLAGTLPTAIYNKGGEMYVQDASGNETLISPHVHGSDKWIFKSSNERTGRRIKVDMEKLVHLVEELSGETVMEEEWKQ